MFMRVNSTYAYQVRPPLGRFADSDGQRLVQSTLTFGMHVEHVSAFVRAMTREIQATRGVTCGGYQPKAISRSAIVIGVR